MHGFCSWKWGKWEWTDHMKERAWSLKWRKESRMKGEVTAWMDERKRSEPHICEKIRRQREEGEEECSKSVF